ncbi:MAG: porin [Bacteroidetes bacterium 4572_77]|nr:MAG: porin [Bacteroidetes bacterium 4572_77]
MFLLLLILKLINNNAKYHIIMTITSRILTLTLSLFFMISLLAQEVDNNNKTNFKFGGFAKADYIFTQYNNGSYNGAGRDFHIPSTIPVGDQSIYQYTDFHIKESRFNFDVSTLVKGKKLRAFVEMDFMLSPGGNERVSNSFNPRIRHFFLEYDKFLFGQTWSTFMIVILPDELDFIGAPEGVVFQRQPMARVTLGAWQFALENKFTTISPYEGGSRITSEAAFLPDFIARYNYKFNSGSISLAVIGRELNYIDETKTKHSAFGAGLTFGGKLKVFKKDDIRFSVTAGKGLGRYVALNFVNSAVIDSSLQLETISTINGYFSYLHHWNNKLRSSASISYFKADNNQDLTGGSVNDEAYSASVNLIYAPFDKLILGVEPIYGYRKLAEGTDGDFFRLQFSAKYAFSFKTSVSNKR